MKKDKFKKIQGPDHMNHPNLIAMLSSFFVGWFGLKYTYFRILGLLKPKPKKTGEEWQEMGRLAQQEIHKYELKGREK